MPTSETRKQDSKRWREAHREEYLVAARESKRKARLDPVKRAAANASSDLAVHLKNSNYILKHSLNQVCPGKIMASGTWIT